MDIRILTPEIHPPPVSELLGVLMRGVRKCDATMEVVRKMLCGKWLGMKLMV